MKRTYYSVLHVLHNDTPETIREAYKKVRKLHEPGLLAHEMAIVAEAKLAKEAFDTLIDPARRAAYDTEMALTTTSVAIASAIEVKPVPFWNMTRIVVWSSVLILVLIAVFYHPNRTVPANPAPDLKKPNAALPNEPAAAAQPADPAAQKSDADVAPAAADSAPNRK